MHMFSMSVMSAKYQIASTNTLRRTDFIVLALHSHTTPTSQEQREITERINLWTLIFILQKHLININIYAKHEKIP